MKLDEKILKFIIVSSPISSSKEIKNAFETDDIYVCLKLLKDRGLITYKTTLDGEVFSIKPTENGANYFIKRREEKIKTIKTILNNLFFTLLGSLLTYLISIL